MKRLFLTLMCLTAMMLAGTSLKAQEATVVLNPGWNWISCPMMDTLDFETAFGSFTPVTGDIIKSRWGYASYLGSGQWKGNISQFYPGYGYHYKSNRTMPVLVTFRVQQPALQVVVTTSELTGITSNSATSGGSITTDAYVFAKGICWATHSDPTPMDDDHSENGGGVESFTAEITELSQNTTYYVRAYVVTQDGIVYGNEVSFTTIPIWTIEATPNPTDGGTITGMGVYEQDAVCTLTAIANEGYIFANWTENGEVVSNDAAYTFTVEAARTLVANFDFDHTYVDLGLPSGTLWATCNLGANLLEEYGDYFAWGETQPKDNFSWTNYQYCMGSFNTLTKYCNNPDIGYNGFTDDLTTLLPEDDAATANWGAEWRMPTQAEWQELYQNTTVTWTTQNGVRGRLFTASNGNSIFLPAAGYCNESIPEAAGIIGDYWTSSLDTDYPSGALSFFFNSSNYYIGFCNRLYGRNVRAVRSGSQSTSFVIDVTANPVEGGVVSGGGSYQEGTVCTLTAMANGGYIFINWTENGVVISTATNYTFTVNVNRTLVANFTPIYNLFTNSGFEQSGGFYTDYTRIFEHTGVDYGQYAVDYNTQGYGIGNLGWPEVLGHGGSGRFMMVNGFSGSDNPNKVVWRQTVTVTPNTDYTFSCYVANLNQTIQGQINPAKLILKINGQNVGSQYNLPTDNDWHAWPNLPVWNSGNATQAIVEIHDNYTGSHGLGDDFAIDDLSFRAQASQSNILTGTIDGKFTINADGDQVYFSQGNLQYQASTNTWRFAENQYDYIGSDNSNISSTYSGWIDLFGWGTSGYNHGANCYQPWSTSQTYSDYYAYGSYTYNLYDQTGQADWGYNPISNGGNTENSGWRTLSGGSFGEWAYVFNTRTTSSGIRYAKANVNNVNGVILLPDDWSSSTYSLSNTNTYDANFSSNTLTASQWSILEQAGAVFLPAAGYRGGTSVGAVGSIGGYWSTSYYTSSNACDVVFNDSNFLMNGGSSRSTCHCVRLVRVVEN